MSDADELEKLRQTNRELEQRLAAVTDRLFLAHEVKNEFLELMSHELRRPLDLILEYADSLEGLSEGLGADHRRYISLISGGGRRLRSMLDRILNLCNLDLGLTRFAPRRFNLRERMDEILKPLSERGERIHVTLRLCCCTDGTIMADEEKFSFVIHELVSNALRYSPPGSRVTIHLREVASPAGSPFLQVTVADEGTGIPVEDLERIFIPFETSVPPPGGESGQGLGLALVKRFVELHGGRVWVQSRPGAGTAFTFSIPREGTYAQRDVIPSLLALVPEKATEIPALLAREGYEIRCMGDPLTALEQAPVLLPDLIVVDQDLPGLEGIEVCLRLKSHAQTRHIPVILIAANPDLRVKILAARSGADALFSKPVEEREFLPKVHRLLSQKFSLDILRRNFQIVSSQAFSDALTGLFNQRHLWPVLDREVERARRYGHLCSVAMFDIDHFKRYNDCYGHLQGDEVLKQAAEILKRSIRTPDIAVRYGGEEFLIIMPETSKELAVRVGEKLRQAFRDHCFACKESQQEGALTISGGVATFPEDAETPRELVDAADRMLYRAKEKGRDRLEADFFSGPDPPEDVDTGS